MPPSTTLPHGGDLASAARQFAIPEDQWLDLSTGISPFPYPISDLTPEFFCKLPGHTEETTLLAAACAAYGVADTCHAIAAPGTQLLIQQLPRLLPRARVTVRTPTYGEHAHCWHLAGHTITEQDFAELPESADVVIIVNPNNPDGRIFSPDILLTWADDMSRRGGLLIVDEAFADVTPDISVANQVGHPGLIVLRSFGKFFGLAGLRLGFVLADTPIVDRLHRALGPWAVSGPALEIGARALGDIRWQQQTRHKLAASANRLDCLLQDHGLTVIGGTDLFRLVDSEQASALSDNLARQAILTRTFRSNPHWMRLGLPATEVHWQRLEAGLGRGSTRTTVRRSRNTVRE